MSATHPDGSDQSLSLWIATTKATSYPPLAGDLETDVAVVGAGITGITAAYLLAREGKRVVLIEKGRIAMSESGHTTAHIVRSTDADYHSLAKQHGEENVQRNTAAIAESIELIRSLVDELKIDCNLRPVDGFLYAEKEEDLPYLDSELEWLQRAGNEVERVTSVPLPFPVAGGIRMPEQYAFHPRIYFLGLAEEAARLGAVIHEQTKALDVETDDGVCTVKTDRGTIRARDVILATHVPINDRGTLWAKMGAMRTYAIAARIDEGHVPDSLFWDTDDPYHYTRLARTSSGLYLIVGGEDRNVGVPENDNERYAALERYTRERYRIGEVAWRWSGQFNQPGDELPFIGRSSHGDHVWTSTGYSGTGMTFGTLGAMILTDLIAERENRYADLYDPKRTKIKGVASTIVEHAYEMPKRLVEKVLRLDVEGKSLAEVAEGEGKILSLEGTKVAACRLNGELHLVDPTCTHMGCTVEWNGAEKSWDCPCHGSRFAPDGEVLNSPATEALGRVTLKDE